MAPGFLDKILHTRPFSDNYLMECNVDEFQPVEPEIVFKTVSAGGGDLDFIKESLKDTTYPGVIDYALKRGLTVYCARSREVLGFLVGNPDYISIEGALVKYLNPDEAYIYGVFVYPKYRGKKVFQGMLSDVYRKLFDGGVRRVYSLVEKGNVESIKAQEKIGARREPVVWTYDKREVNGGKQPPSKDGMKARIFRETDFWYTPLFALSKLLGIASIFRDKLLF